MCKRLSVPAMDEVKRALVGAIVAAGSVPDLDNDRLTAEVLRATKLLCVIEYGSVKA